MTEINMDAAAEWAKKNLHAGLIAPFMGTCLVRALLNLQQNHPERLESVLSTYWASLDNGTLTPFMLEGKAPAGIRNSITQQALYLALNDYFRFKGDFRKSIQASVMLFKAFGVKEPSLEDMIDKVGVDLSQEFIQIMKNHSKG